MVVIGESTCLHCPKANKGREVSKEKEGREGRGGRETGGGEEGTGGEREGRGREGRGGEGGERNKKEGAAEQQWDGRAKA